MRQLKSNNRAQEIIAMMNPVTKPRSPQELLARYNQKRQQYKELKLASDNSPQKREQLAMLYAEAKVLGWALGKHEKTIIQEINFS
ncbi:MAG: hypothetical protein IJ849_13200 [Selenomonadaceae bacterium]|nr:hypothetical protein [Selenomonadaceae bacterium]